MKTKTTLDRPLGATPLLSANILLPEGICKEPFIDSKGNCVAVQLAALMKSPLDCIEQEIDQLYKEMTHDNAGQYEVDGIKQSWREMGVSSTNCPARNQPWDACLCSITRSKDSRLEAR